MAHKLKLISWIAVCFLMVFAALDAFARSHDVSAGMSIEDALLVAKRCVIEATAFEDPNDKGKRYRELRAQDTLEYAGITDNARLNVLRRYIVRNTEFGVQDIWGFRYGQQYSQQYLIRNSALADIDKKWTLEKLAREIIANSGLPFMTYEKASQIVANCRYDAYQPPPPGKNPLDTEEKPPGLDKIITTNLGDKVDEFQTCLLTDKRGIPGSGIIDGEGDFYPYVVERLEARIKEIIAGETYGALVKYMHDDARVDLSPDLTARIAAYVPIVKSYDPKCAQLSFSVSTGCRPPITKNGVTMPAPVINGNTRLSAIEGLPNLSDPDKRSTAAYFESYLSDPMPMTFRKRQAADPRKVPNLSGIEIKDSMTIKKLIEEIRRKLEVKK